MNCMKCGREVPSGQVFCEDCLAAMKQYPVDPDTPVQLPRRQSQSAAVKKTPKRRAVPPEEVIAGLKKQVRLLIIALTVVTVLALALLYPAVRYLKEDHFALGQNYSSVTSQTNGSSSP